MKRLWDKGDAVNPAVLEFTTGKDPELDARLFPFDCLGSAAHARMLGSIGFLSAQEVSQCLEVLKALYQKKAITIPRDLEDCHTMLEAMLTEQIGEVGKKIHTGRSRNDQVQVTMRLYLRDWLTQTLTMILDVADMLSQRARESIDLPLPGYTHMQPAMPTSLGVWYGAFAEGFLENLEEGIALYDAINKNPLGSGSGFDSSLPLDKSLTAQLLRFRRVQSNPIDVQNSRGRIEARVLSWISSCAFVWEKFAWDVILFSSKESGIFTLSHGITTGSSLMPQKRNPDVLELMRGAAGSVRGALTELLFVAGKLPSHYHRDLQLSKEPICRGIDIGSKVFSILPSVLQGITYDEKRAKELMYPELYATYAVFKNIEAGVPFREAYQQTAESLKSALPDPRSFEKEFAQSINHYRPRLEILSKDIQAIRITIEKARSSEIEMRESIFKGH